MGTLTAGVHGQPRTLPTASSTDFSVGLSVACSHQTSCLDCAFGQLEPQKRPREIRWGLLWICIPTPAWPQGLQGTAAGGGAKVWGAVRDQDCCREGMHRVGDAHHAGQRGGLPPPPVPVAAEQPSGGGRGGRAAALPLGRPEAERVHPAQLLCG